MLPVWTAVNVGRDLLEGSVLRQDSKTGGQELYLKRTERSLGSAAASRPTAQ